MSYGAKKQRLINKQDIDAVPEKRLPAYKRQRELYYSHVWLDREIYAQVMMFIGWERKRKYSIKMAVRILLELGLQRYIIKQINLAKEEQGLAKKNDQEPPPPNDFVKDMRKRARKMKLPSVV
jgi:hypothetical protein